MARPSWNEAEYTNLIWNLKYPFLLTNCDIPSPSFSIDAAGVTRINLNFCSKQINESVYNVSLQIKKHELNFYPGTITLDIKMSISGNVLKDDCPLQHVAFTEQSKIIFEKEFSITNVKDLSMESEVTFILDIEPNANCMEVEEFWACNDEDLESLSSDIANLLPNKSFANLELRSIDDKPVRLNMTIFASRYTTLAESLDLFRNPKQELKLGIAREGISALLDYLYSGKINIGRSNYGLLELLNKAQLFHLQRILYSEPRIVHASTSVPLKYESFVWVIPKFSELEDNTCIDNYLCCGTLALWTQIRIQFYIEENADGERCVMFSLQRIQDDGKLLVSCNITIIGENEYHKLYKLKFEHQRELITSFIKVQEIQEKKDNYLENDALKLRFEMIISNLKVASEYDSVRCLHVKRGNFPSIVSNLWALRKDIARLYRNPQFTDVSIRTESSLIPAHKVVLCARSPYFSRILEDDIESNSIFINTYDTTIVEDILSYIYSGDVKSDSKSFEWAINLYKATKEFEIETLKKKCFRFIVENVNSDNVSILLNKL